MDIIELQNVATQVRRDIIRMVHGAHSGHPGGSLGCADFLTALFFRTMEIDPKQFTREGRGEDMFFLSNGHIAPLLYSVLARRGYFPTAELGTFRKLHTRLQGHPSAVEGLPGLRVSAGSLGQGLSVAVGAALAKKADNDNHLIFSLVGDGELQEGQNWEAIMFAGSKQVDNLILTVDNNGKQIDGPTDSVCNLGKLRAKFEAFKWMVLDMNGNDMKKCVQTLALAKTVARNRKPIAIIMRTEMGCGVDFMKGNHKWHGTAPNDEQTAAALAQIPVTLGDY